MHHAIRRSFVRPVAIGLAGALFALGLSTPARARANGCTVATTPMAFGTYLPMTGTMVSTVANVTYTCTSKIRRGIKILLENGQIIRAMKDRGAAANSQAYSLHFLLTLDPTGTIPWGDGTGGTQVYFDPNPPINQPVTVQIYGFIPQSQDPEAGRYQEALSIIAHF